MKLVEFTRDMRPQMAGSTRILPDDVAARLEAEGAVRNVRPWPERTDSGVPVVAAPQVTPVEKPRLSLPGGRRGYQTK